MYHIVLQRPRLFAITLPVAQQLPGSTDGDNTGPSQCDLKTPDPIDYGTMVRMPSPWLTTELYQRDLDMKKLARQVLLLPELTAAGKKTPELGNRNSETSLATIADIMCAVPLAKIMFAEIDKLLQLYMTIPVTTAPEER